MYIYFFLASCLLRTNKLHLKSFDISPATLQNKAPLEHVITERVLVNCTGVREEADF